MSIKAIPTSRKSVNKKSKKARPKRLTNSVVMSSRPFKAASRPASHLSKNLAKKATEKIVSKKIGEAARKNATVLDLSGSGITKVPPVIEKLRQLQAVNLSGNQLTRLPKAISTLTQLQELNLANNKLTSLPRPIRDLVSLKRLYLDSNQLTRIPKVIGNLSRLESLTIARNQLASLPQTIGKLPQLKELSLANNKLTSLPEALKAMTSLTQLLLHDNPELKLPREVLGPSAREISEGSPPASPSSILDYYFRTRRGAQPLNEIKLILVGRGEVGKTALVNQLAHGIFTDEGKTEGIKITQLPLRCLNDEIRANVWDFGGQEIMHGTHQFFLTERSLYLIVLSGRSGGEDADVEHWLKLIGSFGGDSPVIIVLNKIEEHRFDLNRPALREKYSAIHDFVETDCKTGMGVERLREVIIRETERLEHVRASFPGSWIAIKERLTTPGEDFISFERFRAICQELGEHDENGQDSLARHLHNLGIALNYKDDPRLRETSVLNPHWVTTGIYRLLNAQALSARGGELRVSDLSQLLPKEGYPREKHTFLLELMRKFELCFPLDEEGERYLVPELLGKQEPTRLAGKFPPNWCLNFEYHYAPILPEGLLPRFIVRTYTHALPYLRWRTGVVLEFEENAALVKADVQDRRVVVRVDGPVNGRRRLLAVIRAHFEHIHRDFKKLQPVSKVPVPGHPTVLVDYQDLLDYEAAEDDEIKVKIQKKPVKLSVRELLEGVNLPIAKGRRNYGLQLAKQGLAVFYSYSHKDERLRDELQTHLTILKLEGLIDDWHDRRIVAGKEWDKEIMRELENADIILLLVSADFMASTYCRDKEVKRAMQRHTEGSAQVIPVILRECDWRTAPFSKLQAVPKNARFVDGLRQRRDKAWTEVVLRLREAITDMYRKGKREITRGES